MNNTRNNHHNYKNREKKKWQWKETDLIDDMTSIRISALTHASKIASQVTHCTLGASSLSHLSTSSSTSSSSSSSVASPDSNIKIYIRNDFHKNQNNKIQLSENKLNSSDSKKYDIKVCIENDLYKNGKKPSSAPITPRKVEILDSKFINSKILYKTLEKERINQVNKQKNEFIHKIIKEEDNKLKKIYEKQLEDHNEWLIKNNDYEKKLLNDIECKTQKLLDKKNKELNDIRKNTENQLHLIALDGILKYQKRFRITHERVGKLLKSASIVTLTTCEEHNHILKILLEMFDKLQIKVKKNIIGPSEVKSAENLCLELENLEINLIKDIDNFEKTLNNEIQNIRNEAAINQNKANGSMTTAAAPAPEPVVSVAAAAATIVDGPSVAQIAPAQQPPLPQPQPVSKPIEPQQQQQQQQQIIQQQQPIETQSIQTNVSSSASSSSSTNNSNNMIQNFVSNERLQFYNNIMAYYHSKVEAVKALQADESMKKYRFTCQKAINTPVNAISGVSSQHLQDKFDKIFSFITGNPVKTQDGGIISTSDHPLGRDYCLLLLAKKFVSQGDSLISSNAQAAFPIASIIVSIWKNIPEFGTLFLAYTFKESPYLVPYFLPQQRGQSNEDYLKSLGYRTVDGILEKQDMYLKRQAGYMRLYATIMITDSRIKDSGLIHPYGLENGWKWLCNLLNLEPLPDICATLIFEFLQIVGCDTWQLYGRQFNKMLTVFQQEYFPKLSMVDEGGPKSRLEVFLQKVIQEGKINKPQGTLAKNFW